MISIKSALDINSSSPQNSSQQQQKKVVQKTIVTAQEIIAASVCDGRNGVVARKREVVRLLQKAGLIAPAMFCARCDESMTISKNIKVKIRF